MSKHMSNEAVKTAIVAIVAGQKSTYGAAMKIAQALKDGNLKAAELQEVLYTTYEEGTDERKAVMQAIRVALSRITGQPKVGEDGKKVMKDGIVVLESPKMTISTNNPKRDDKTLNYTAAAERAAKPARADASGKASVAAVEAGAVVTEVGPADKRDFQLWHKALLDSVTKFMTEAPMGDRIQLATAVNRVFTEQGNLYINVPEVKEQPAKRIRKAA